MRLAKGAVLFYAAARIAEAQPIHGRLLDSMTGRPIPSGTLTLLAADNSTVMTAVSDSAGVWRLLAPQAGVYSVAAKRVGYQPGVSAQISIVTGAGANLDVRLEPVPVSLDAATARAIRRNLEDNGFFERQKSNFGHFLTPEAIDRRNASRISDLLVPIPGVQLVAGSSGSAGPLQVSLRGSSSTDAALCRPRVFVDGLMYTRGDSRPVRARSTDATEREDIERRMDQALAIDDIGHPSTIAAIEVYRSATQVPVQFGGTSVETLCGVIVVWTRNGRNPSGNP